jgi:hypothetical protein
VAAVVALSVELAAVSVAAVVALSVELAAVSVAVVALSVELAAASVADVALAAVVVIGSAIRIPLVYPSFAVVQLATPSRALWVANSVNKRVVSRFVA